MNVLISVCNAILFVFALLYSYRGIAGLLGIFLHKKYESAENLHRYAVVIAARNEETVIGNLLDSIREQDYPQHLITVFVVADNCTDRTADIARSRGAVCYERTNRTQCTKGYALQYLFARIRKDFGENAF